MRARALTCLAAAASSVKPEVREAVKRSIGAQTATDPLLQTPRGMRSGNETAGMWSGNETAVTWSGNETTVM